MLESFRKVRLLAAVPVIGAAALVLPMAAPAGADTLPSPRGVGVASGIVHGTITPTIACTGGGGYVFQGVGIAGATLVHDSPVAGSAAVTTPAPAGVASGDPLDGTPLGCGAGNIWKTITDAAGGAGAPAGTPVTCPVPTVGVVCNPATGGSNILADEGTVVGAGGAANFGCDVTVSPIGCTLSGTFVRFGATVLVALTGKIWNPAAEAQPAANNADVLVAAQVVPTVATPDSAFAGPYVITPIANRNATVVSALDKLYCPLGGASGYPPTATC